MEKKITIPAILLLALLIIRLIGMAIIPLNDVTEARYGEIARKMVETGDWVTLYHDYEQPFLAKPPLSTWLSALSMRLFGVTSFAARLPSFLLSLGTAALVGWVFYRKKERQKAFLALFILFCTPAFFIASGTVMTDPTLLFCTTLMMVAFFLAKESRLWSYLFFVGGGLGLLAKGPIALVLVGFPILLWTLWKKQWSHFFSLPWGWGSLVLLFIALPWYLLAEIRTPGFFSYFFVGEHFHRFLQKGWQGDLYGFAHAFPLGTIWLFALLFFLPWSFILPFLFTRKAVTEQWDSFLLFMLLVPLCFFTFSANIIWPYCLVSVTAFALLFATLWRKNTIPWKAALPLLCLSTVLLFINPDHSQKQAIQAWQMVDPAASHSLTYWAKQLDFSAAFYSHGRAKATQDLQVAQASDFLLWPSNKPFPFPETFDQVASIPLSRRPYTLFKKKFFDKIITTDQK